jgi:hypothetical protein
MRSGVRTSEDKTPVIPDLIRDPRFEASAPPHRSPEAGDPGSTLRFGRDDERKKAQGIEIEIEIAIEIDKEA